MQTRVDIGKKAILLTLLVCCGFIAIAQTKDSTVIIGTTDPYTTSPAARAGKPFYDLFNPDAKGFRPTALYSSEDQIYVGVHYNAYSKNWSPDSSGRKHVLYAHYSLEQRAFSFGYKSIYNRLVGNWNLFLDADYDWVKWMNFYGLGNETTNLTNDNKFYRLRTKEASLSAGFFHKIGKQSNIVITPFYRRFQLINDLDRYWIKEITANNRLGDFNTNNFGGVRVDLQLQRLDNMLLPTKGIVFTTGVEHTLNFDESKVVTNYRAYNRVYVPLSSRFILSVENGFAALTGEPEFYQLNNIGGKILRGFRRQRFWGETVYHNNNELQYVFDVNQSWFQGKLGFLALFDQGRVWKKGEVSNAWHYGYGGGILLVPYNKISLSAQYAISNERKGFHFEFRRAL
jgi:hypothetical protein